MLVLVVAILGISLKMSVKFGNNIGKVKLVDKVGWWDVFFVVFRCVIGSWRRRRWRRDLFDEGHGGLKYLFGGFLVVPLRRGHVGFYILLRFVWHCPGFALVPMCCHRLGTLSI